MSDELKPETKEQVSANMRGTIALLRAELLETQKALHELGVEHLALKDMYESDLTEEELVDVGMLIPNDIRKVDYRIREVRSKRDPSRS